MRGIQGRNDKFCMGAGNTVNPPASKRVSTCFCRTIRRRTQQKANACPYTIRFGREKKKNRQSVSEPSDETRRAALRGHRGRSGVAGSPFNACFRAFWHVGGRKETLGSSGPCIRRKPPCLFLISSKLCCHAAIVFSRGHGTHLKHRGPDSPRTPSARRYARML